MDFLVLTLGKLLNIECFKYLGTLLFSEHAASRLILQLNTFHFINVRNLVFDLSYIFYVSVWRRRYNFVQRCNLTVLIEQNFEFRWKKWVGVIQMLAEQNFIFTNKLLFNFFFGQLLDCYLILKEFFGSFFKPFLFYESRGVIFLENRPGNKHIIINALVWVVFSICLQQETIKIVFVFL